MQEFNYSHILLDEYSLSRQVLGVRIERKDTLKQLYGDFKIESDLK